MKRSLTFLTICVALCIVLLFFARTQNLALSRYSAEQAAMNKRAILERTKVRQLIGSALKTATKHSESPKAISAGPTGNTSQKSALLRKAVMACASARYSLLLSQVRATPEQRQQFLEIAGEGIYRLHDLEQAVNAEHLNFATGLYTDLRNAQIAETQAAEASVLRDQQKEAFHLFERLDYPRSVVGSVAGELYASDPLTNDQVQAISNAITTSDPAFIAGKSATVDFDPTVVESKLSSVLDSAQLKAVSSRLEADVASQVFGSAYQKAITAKN